ncbi:hypothetical protein E2F43_07285 [Seongchinamella unica]|uniref:Transporter n=1 Tax=Seongchinamella unica TaxID=2547392 RepID=A0A4R5LR49_9GAMM|nr:hypothetical protein [Seongchinamella unica]TDG13338.1 hypothetical protein E2F43_07285 [Seongchinamella unica]
MHLKALSPVFTAAAFCFCLTANAAATGLSWSGRLGAGSGFVNRGVVLGQKDLIPHLNIAVEHRSGLFTHGWLTKLNIPEPYPYQESDNEWQAMAAIGYQWPATTSWSLAIVQSWYRYPWDADRGSQDYRETTLSLEYSPHLVFDYTYTPDLWGLGRHQHVGAVTGRWSFVPQLLGAGTAGWVTQGGTAGDDYAYLQLSLGYLFGSWSMQLQFHQGFGMNTAYPDAQADREWIAQINWHW